jgi:hypothetical protein
MSGDGGGASVPNAACRAWRLRRHTTPRTCLLPGDGLLWGLAWHSDALEVQYAHVTLAGTAYPPPVTFNSATDELASV